MNRRFLLRSTLVEGVSSRPSFDLHGTQDELRAIVDAVAATRLFESVLMDDTKNLDEIMEALRRKHTCARRFERTLGLTWVL